MKTALLHYWLTNMRGGEKVLAALGEMLPEADIFTHAFGQGMREEGEVRREKGRGLCWKGHGVKESFIARLPLGRKHPQAYLPLMPVATRSLDLNGYDLIVSSESGPIKGVRKPAAARHICYCHTPMRYVWDMYDDYYRSAGVGGKVAMKLFTPYMRREDLKSAESVDTFVANSAFVADRIKRIYGRDSVVVHPPVDIEFFAEAGALPQSFPFEPKSYYLYAGELRDYKRPDLAVEACLKMGRKLVVIGNGKMRNALARRASGRGDIVFLGRVSDDELRGVYSNAKALLFPGMEDFGIVPVEAQASGVPVIAFGKGGALETVVDGRTGTFFREATPDSLCDAIMDFEKNHWDEECCRFNAKRFSKENFLMRMQAILNIKDKNRREI
jgi:glycosyltransferase involved in cell wall biosynthesis